VGYIKVAELPHPVTLPLTSDPYKFNSQSAAIPFSDFRIPTSDFITLCPLKPDT
jgi:hypothetical protein